jgi:hypothetical protein
MLFEEKRRPMAFRLRTEPLLLIVLRFGDMALIIITDSFAINKERLGSVTKTRPFT